MSFENKPALLILRLPFSYLFLYVIFLQCGFFFVCAVKRNYTRPDEIWSWRCGGDSDIYLCGLGKANVPFTLISKPGFFKEDYRYLMWTCRDPIFLILGTRFSLILGTRFGSLKHLKNCSNLTVLNSSNGNLEKGYACILSNENLLHSCVYEAINESKTLFRLFHYDVLSFVSFHFMCLSCLH